MRDITVNKADLIETLLKNKENHQKIFEEAVQGYRARVIKLLEMNLASARAGHPVNLQDFSIQQPINQTKDYERVITMLKMDIQTEVKLSEADFACYVLDQWGWRNNFLFRASAYSDTAKTIMDSAAENEV